ncbi:hypothetical protein ACOI1H_21565 [Loktanella sp. DJP18]|uniref:hypothetical protein n=1 Tax=Loktanella sp. DJP18 TaxID=3409788 RepID=UPI003BB6CE09
MGQGEQAGDTGFGAMRRRFAIVLESVRDRSLLERKTETVTARINPELLRLARERSGVESTSALVELAIANLAAEDGFPEAFSRARGRVPADIDLEV